MLVVMGEAAKGGRGAADPRGFRTLFYINTSPSHILIKFQNHPFYLKLSLLINYTFSLIVFFFFLLNYFYIHYSSHINSKMLYFMYKSNNIIK